jgi:hypothetical protein
MNCRKVCGKAVYRRQDRPVVEVLPGLLRESGVDERRLAVRDGIAEDGVVVGHDAISL